MYGKRNISPEEREALSEKAKKGAQMVAEKLLDGDVRVRKGILWCSGSLCEKVSDSLDFAVLERNCRLRLVARKGSFFKKNEPKSRTFRRNTAWEINMSAADPPTLKILRKSPRRYSTMCWTSEVATLCSFESRLSIFGVQCVRIPMNLMIVRQFPINLNIRSRSWRRKPGVRKRGTRMFLTVIGNTASRLLSLTTLWTTNHPAGTFPTMGDENKTNRRNKWNELKRSSRPIHRSYTQQNSTLSERGPKFFTPKRREQQCGKMFEALPTNRQIAFHIPSKAESIIHKCRTEMGTHHMSGGRAINRATKLPTIP
ncbi:unnamed protein product [Nesidiocoris tenuis]|uniref:Uncharacterized protein n=1 Tax=Nesidiocoris tenuis TaxID=355587 RepID=A0A6H5GCN9_9HEMI|nr:unnamed protein product [Nesidiocoris tenuis]